MVLFIFGYQHMSLFYLYALYTLSAEKKEKRWNPKAIVSMFQALNKFSKKLLFDCHYGLVQSLSLLHTHSLSHLY